MQPRYFLLIVCALSACTRRDVDKAGTPDVPLVIVLSPAHQPSRQSLAKLDDAIEKRSGLTVEVRVAESPTKAIEAFAGKSADIGLLTLLEALLTRQEYETTTIARVVREDGALEYAGALVVRAADPIQKLEDLAGKRVAFVNELSVSGYVLPMVMLSKTPIAEATLAGSHEAALEALRAGDVDAAATYQSAAAKDPSLRIIASTPRVPNEPLVARAGLDGEKARRVVEALNALASTPEGRMLLVDLGDITRFAPANDKDYDAAIEALRNAGKQVEDAIAGGRAIARSNHALLLSD